MVRSELKIILQYTSESYIANVCRLVTVYSLPCKWNCNKFVKFTSLFCSNAQHAVRNEPAHEI